VLSTSVLLSVSYKKRGVLAGNKRDIAHSWIMEDTYYFNNNTCTCPFSTRIYFW